MSADAAKPTWSIATGSSSRCRRSAGSRWSAPPPRPGSSSSRSPSRSEIGLFGLAGLVGAVTAMRTGRLHDGGHNRIATDVVAGDLRVS